MKVYEHTNEKAKLKENLAKYEKEMVELSVQVVEHQDTCKTLSCENNILNTRLDEITKHNFKRKGEEKRIQFYLEEELTETKASMTISVERNLVLERELV